MSDLRDDAAAGFRNLTGREPDGLWSAPGRVNLIGEHTDYNDGFVFPFAIDRRTVVALGRREDRRIRVATAFSDDVVEIGLDELEAARSSGWAAYPLGMAWVFGLGPFEGVTEAVGVEGVSGFDAFIDSNVPVGAGLSSSAALECAIGVALNEVWELGLTPEAIARAGQRAENEFVGAPTGIMDQSASMLGREDSGVFLDCRSLDAEVIPLRFAEAGLAILVIDSRVEHEHSSGGYRERRESCERGARELGVESLRELSLADLARARELLDDLTVRRVRHVVTENQRVLDTVRTLHERGPRAIGDLLDASHRSMRDDFEISVPELDLIVETAQANGAVGARMTGGGFGGSAIALVPEEAVSLVQVAIDGAFAEHGYTAPVSFVVRPSDGAGRA
ncbi:MAG: galactokinase [Micrococcales bacterium]|nr:galactokinase [Micrococcales bacterium]